MIGWELSRVIIEIPWLHNMIGFTFLFLLFSCVLAIPYLLYKLIRSGPYEKQVEWSFEGKPWSYWKNFK